MPAKETIVVNKVPLEKKYIDHPQYFSRFEQLYLELIENKTKIKQHLINKDYSPPQHSSSDDRSPQEGGFNKMFSPTTTHSSKSSIAEHYTPESKKSEPTLPKQEERLFKLEQQIKEADEVESIKSQESHKSIPESIKSTKTSKSSKQTRTTHSSRKEKPANNVSEKLQYMLGMDKPTATSYKEKYTHKFEDSRYEEYQKSRKRLPTLSELEKQGATDVRRDLADAARLNVDDEDTKRELLFKFDLLRRSYREEQIPTHTIHTDLTVMQRSYDDTVRRLSLDSAVENYKRYLIGAFMLIEFVLGKYMKLDMKGYTQQQIISMSSYEKLLIEIGEKAYMPEGEQWSVELRLAFLVMINTAFFIVGKTIMASTGTNLMNAINGMNKAYTKPQEQAPPKKKMQGPNINLDDLPDISEM